MGAFFRGVEVRNYSWVGKVGGSSKRSVKPFLIGSSSILHLPTMLAEGNLVRRKSVTLVLAGSIPVCQPKALVAQLVEATDSKPV